MANPRINVFSRKLVSLMAVFLMMFYFVPIQTANAAVITDPATGGSAINSSTAGGAYTTLAGPTLTEQSNKDIGVGTIILNSPSGFEFDTGTTVNAYVLNQPNGDGANLTLTSGTALVTSSSITITVASIDEGVATKSTLVWSGIKVRPTAVSPLASGNITKSGTANIVGVINGSTNLGTLTEVDNVRPTAAITYSEIPPSVMPGDTLYITASFSEPMAVSPVPKIAISGANTVAASDMTKLTDTSYYYSYTVGTGDGTATVTLSEGRDLAGLTIISAPTSGATFTVDSIAPICPTPTITKGTNPGAQHIVGSTIFYTTKLGAGSFTVDENATDTTDIPKVNFPDTVSLGGDDTSPPYQKTYNFSSSPESTFNGTATINCQDNVGNAATSNFTVSRDNEAPVVNSVALDKYFVKDGATINITSDVTDNTGSGISSCHAYWSSDNALGGDTDLGDLGTDCSGVVTVPSGSGTHYILIGSTLGLGDNVGIFTQTNLASSVITMDNNAPSTTDNTVFGDQAYFETKTFTLTPSDSGSGVADTKYCVADYPATCTPNISGTSVTATCPAGLASCPKWIFYQSTDNAGNIEGSGMHSFRFYITNDLIAPTTTDSGIDGNWHSSDVTVSLACNDTGGSGCATTYYTTDGTDPSTSSSTGNSFTLGSEGVHIIKYFSVDGAGNSETIKTAVNQVKIDKSAPIATITSPGSGLYFGTTVPSIDLVFADSGNLYSAQYKFDDGIWNDIFSGVDSTSVNSSIPNQLLWDSIAQGLHEVFFKVTDDANNIFETPVDGGFEIGKDTVEPTINSMVFASRTGTVTGGNTIGLELSGVTDGNLASAGNINVSENSTLQITSPATGGPIPLTTGDNSLTTSALFGYSIEASELKATAVAYALGGMIPVQGTLTDAVGNVSNITINIMVDITGPTLSVVSPVITPTKDTSPSFTFSSTEAGEIVYGGACGGSIFTATIGNNIVDLVTSGDKIYNNCTVAVIDVYGNPSLPLSIPSFTVDTIAPVIALNGSSPVDVVYGDSYSELSATTDDGSFVTIGGDTVTSSSPVGAYHITYDAVDSSGNHATQAIRTVNVTKADANISVTGGTFTFDNMQHAATGFAYGVGGISDVLSPAIAMFYESIGSPVYASYTAPTGAGTYNVLADFSGNDNYNIAINTTTVTINQATQAISFGALTNKNFGDPNFDISATGGASGNPVTFTASNQCAIYGTATVHLDSPGTCTITAHQVGNSNYSAALDVTQSFDITDITGPVISGTPTDITDEAVSASGNVVSWTSPTAIDDADGSVPVNCIPTKGSTFPIGNTVVTCSATDSSANTSTTAFNVKIQDTTAPTITLLGDPQIIEVGSVSVYTDPKATFNDAVDGTFVIRGNSRNKVNVNVVGTYTFDYTAADNAGNVATPVTRTVEVVDTTPPLAPVADPDGGDYYSDQSVTLTGETGAEIRYTIDGTTPTETNGIVYAGTITIGVDTVLKAVAIDSEGNISSVMTEAYGIAPVISAQSSSSVTTTTATITWTTDDPSTSRVVYDTVSHSAGTAPNYGYAYSTIEDSTKVTSHSVGLTGLTAGTTYYYRTISHGSPEAYSAENSVKTTAIVATRTTSTNPSTSGVLTTGISAVGDEVATAETAPEVQGTETTKTVDKNVQGSEDKAKNDDTKGDSWWNWWYLLIIFVILAGGVWLIFGRKPVRKVQ